MKPIPVESTTLATVAYDTDRELLQLGSAINPSITTSTSPLACMKICCAPRRRAVTLIAPSEIDSYTLGSRSFLYLGAYGGRSHKRLLNEKPFLFAFGFRKPLSDLGPIREGVH